jgi:hypothetical protein
MRLYRYVGPNAIRARAAPSPQGWKVRSVRELEAWMRRAGQRPNRQGVVVVTFVVDERGELRVADRGTEHIACSGDRPVLSAGELFFGQSDGTWRVEEVSNQSTGFCPEPESWPAVAAALDRCGIAHPGRFTQAVVFRRCPACGERSIVKDEVLVCGLCGGELPGAWNC